MGAGVPRLRGGPRRFVAGEADEIGGIAAVDDLTIELTLSRPDVTIPGVLAIPPFYALPAEEVQAEGKRSSSRWDRSWKLEELYQSQRRYRCSRFTDYIYADQLPYFDDCLEWGITPTLEAQRVQRGELEAMGARARPDRAPAPAEWRRRADLQLWESLPRLVRVRRHPPAIRRPAGAARGQPRLQPGAAATAVDPPAGHFYPTALLGYDPEATVYAYDPERAQALLDEAEVTGLEIPCRSGARPGREPAAAAAGPGCGRHHGDPGAGSGQRVRIRGRLARDVSGLARGWGMGLPDPAELYNSMMKTGAHPTTAATATKRSTASAPRRSDDRPAARGELYAQAEQILLDDARPLRRRPPVGHAEAARAAELHLGAGPLPALGPLLAAVLGRARDASAGHAQRAGRPAGGDGDPR